MEKAVNIVQKLMYENDAFSKWMDIVILDISPGNCTLKAEIKPAMLNGFQICHGGVTYSIGDSALAFASNSHGIKAVSVETSISHTKTVYSGDTITAVATEKNLTRRFGIYEVVLHNQKKEIVALFKGTVFRTDKEWEV
ncbi:MAG: hotdog fold thioesterase [Saprospiraceae bacterium]|nr:hotdog fold thioesterase [Saprospiraceae bacterium]